MEPPPHFGSCRQRVPPPGCPSACEPRPAHGAPTHGAPALLSPSSFQLQHGLAPDVRQQQTPVLRARGLPGLRHRLLLPLRRRLHGERAAVRRRRYAASPSPSPSLSLSLSPSLCPRVPCPPAEQGARSAAQAQAPPPPQLSQAGGDASSQPRSLLPVPRTGAPGRSVSPVPCPAAERLPLGPRLHTARGGANAQAVRTRPGPGGASAPRFPASLKLLRCRCSQTSLSRWSLSPCRTSEGWRRPTRVLGDTLGVPAPAPLGPHLLVPLKSQHGDGGAFGVRTANSRVLSPLWGRFQNGFSCRRHHF